MKTKYYIIQITLFLLSIGLHAQNVTTVTAKHSDISDNLDLRAVASIFGDSRDLQDFEYRLNDPKNQISNLDLNYDRKVDYLRVIEVVESYTHVIILQAVLDRDVYQDVATIEVEKDRHNNVQIQVVGDPYFYGSNYIYEPVYVRRPLIYNVFWASTYRPYYSSYYWNYYPSFYYAWSPYPIYRYRKNIHVHINVHNHYNYVNTRRSNQAVALYSDRRSNGYERMHPDKSFAQRNNVSNRYELENRRNSTQVSTRNTVSTNQNNLSSNNRNAQVTTRNNQNVNKDATGNSNKSVSTPSNTRNITSSRNNTMQEKATVNNNSTRNVNTQSSRSNSNQSLNRQTSPSSRIESSPSRSSQNTGTRTQSSSSRNAGNGGR